MARGWSRERWSVEVGTALLAVAVAATVAGRPVRRLLARFRGRRAAMAEEKSGRGDEPRVEGEGSRTADRAYREGVKEHLRRGNVEEEAERAARELDERSEELRRAEEEGRRRSAGDLPSDLDR